MLTRRVSVSALQMVQLQTHKVFTEIKKKGKKTGNEVKVNKHDGYVEITSETGDSNAVDSAVDHISSYLRDYDIRELDIHLDKDNYELMCEEAKKKFRHSSILFLHYEMFKTNAAMLQEQGLKLPLKEYYKLHKANPEFCFLVAPKNKIEDLEHEVNSILQAEMSCVSRTLSQGHYSHSGGNIGRRTLSVQSLNGSFRDLTEEEGRLTARTQNSQEELYEITDSFLQNLDFEAFSKVRSTGRYKGSIVSIEESHGKYDQIRKRLYFANRLSSCPCPFIQPVYAYFIEPRNQSFFIVTDRKYQTLDQRIHNREIESLRKRIDVLTKVAEALNHLHHSWQIYGSLNAENVLFDCHGSIWLRAAVTRDVPRCTDPFQYDVHSFLMLAYWLLTDSQLPYSSLMQKINKGRTFCRYVYTQPDYTIREFILSCDELLYKDINLTRFVNIVKELNQTI